MARHFEEAEGPFDGVRSLYGRVQLTQGIITGTVEVGSAPVHPLARRLTLVALSM
jgi:hypothetical protein